MITQVNRVDIQIALDSHDYLLEQYKDLERRATLTLYKMYIGRTKGLIFKKAYTEADMLEDVFGESKDIGAFVQREYPIKGKLLFDLLFKLDCHFNCIGIVNPICYREVQKYDTKAMRTELHSSEASVFFLDAEEFQFVKDFSSRTVAGLFKYLP